MLQVFDDEIVVNEKCATLAQWILSSKHVVLHTGAGISTSAGIPDFRCETKGIIFNIEAKKKFKLLIHIFVVNINIVAQMEYGR